MRFAPIPAALLVALLVGGCSHALGGPVSTQPAQQTAVVVAVELFPNEHLTGAVETRYYRIGLDEGSSTLLATIPNYASDPAPSTDGQRVLVSADERGTKPNIGVGVLDAVDGGIRSVLQTDVATYGWDGDAIVAVLGQNEEIRAGWPNLPFRVSGLVRIDASGATTVPLSASQFRDPNGREPVHGLSYLGSDRSGLYFVDADLDGPVWRVSRQGLVTTVASTTAPAGQAPVHSLYPRYRVPPQPLPPDTAARAGVPVVREVLTGVTSTSERSVNVCRLRDFAVLRSIPLVPAPPPGFPPFGFKGYALVLDPSLTRCLRPVPALRRSPTPLGGAIWESTEATSRPLVRSTAATSVPFPLGYVGGNGDFVWCYKSRRSADVYLYQRSSDTSKLLARLAPSGAPNALPSITRLVFCGTVTAGPAQ